MGCIAVARSNQDPCPPNSRSVYACLAVARRCSPLLAVVSLISACRPERPLESTESITPRQSFAESGRVSDSTTTVSFTIQGGRERFDPVNKPLPIVGSVTRRSDGSTKVGLQSWYRGERDQVRLYPVAVTVRRDGSFTQLLSNGEERLINTSPTLTPKGLTEKEAAILASSRNPRFAVPPLPQLARPAGAVTRRPRELLHSESAVRLAEARRYYAVESRISPTTLQFSRTRGQRSIRMVYDEALGAEVEIEMQDENGRTVVRSIYEAIPGGVRLARRETRVSGKHGNWTIVDNIAAPQASGGVK